MPLGGLFGAAEQNAENRRKEGRDWRRAVERHHEAEDIREAKHDFDAERYYDAIADNEANLRFQEQNLIQQYNAQRAAQDYEFDVATRAYNKSNAEHYQQKNFNIMAEANAMMEQNLKLRDDLLGVMFEETDSMIKYVSDTSGLKLTKASKLTQADFDEARFTTKFQGDLGQYQLDRRKARSEAKIKSQNAIVAGMKLAGEIRAKAGAGRSAAKAVLGVMAESGAARSAIANGLMYAEQGFDLGVAQLRDMLILDQTINMAARDFAENEYTLKSSTLDAVRDVDKIKIDATKKSIKDRDSIVRRMISHERAQADLRAEASVMMKPQPLPAPPDPREMYAQYDDPETEDYVEMLLRPTTKAFPDFIRLEAPKREDFDYGRRNVAAANFGDAFKVAGMAASLAGGIGAIGATASGGGALFNMTASQANLWGGIGTSLGGLGNSFYP